jgi:hypothetical protein
LIFDLFSLSFAHDYMEDRRLDLQLYTQHCWLSFSFLGMHLQSDLLEEFQLLLYLN